MFESLKQHLQAAARRSLRIAERVARRPSLQLYENANLKNSPAKEKVVIDFELVFNNEQDWKNGLQS